MIFRHLLNMRSHPMWVRGLKLYFRYCPVRLSQSHPMWVRGLKHTLCFNSLKDLHVAPYVGAWIETNTETGFKF